VSRIAGKASLAAAPEATNQMQVISISVETQDNCLFSTGTKLDNM
jgi:hypothetical protein